MRIMVLCSDTGVRIGDRKGASLHLHAIAHALADLGHDVVAVGVAASADSAGPTWRVSTRLVAHPGRSTGLERERRKLSTVREVRELGRAVLAEQPVDLVYERLSLFGDAGIDLAAAATVPLVLEVNSLLATEEADWRGLQLAARAAEVEKRVLGAADVVVAVSDEVADQVRVQAPGRAVTVVPNGVDAAMFADLPERADARQHWGLPADADLLVFSGSLRPWHGLAHAVDALAHLPERVELVVVGDGPIRTELKARADELGVAGRVHWLGQVEHRTVPTVLAACDVALAPYPALPGFGFSPLKLYEYLAAGLPVVASDLGQLRGLVACGRLVAPGDERALAAGVLEVLSDPATAQAAAAARIDALAEHSWARRAEDVVHAVKALQAAPGWRVDHPLRTDPSLSPYADAAACVALGWDPGPVLRYVPERRVATLMVDRADGTRRAVLKVFTGPRARGNHRRLLQLSAGPAAGSLPHPLGVDPDGHAVLLSYQDGIELDRLPDADFVDRGHAVGVALRELHDSQVQLDRRWGLRRELEQLFRRALPFDLPDLLRQGGLDDVLAVHEDGLDPAVLEGDDWVCAHRDAHPRQVIVDPAGAVHWIDLDDAAMAPRGLDVGNMAAHLQREHLRGARSLAVAQASEQGFLSGYGDAVDHGDLRMWTSLALLRLAGLALTRHDDPPLSERLLERYRDVTGAHRPPTSSATSAQREVRPRRQAHRRVTTPAVAIDSPT